MNVLYCNCNRNCTVLWADVGTAISTGTVTGTGTDVEETTQHQHLRSIDIDDDVERFPFYHAVPLGDFILYTTN